VLRQDCAVQKERRENSAGSKNNAAAKKVRRAKISPQSKNKGTAAAQCHSSPL